MGRDYLKYSRINDTTDEIVMASILIPNDIIGENGINIDAYSHDGFTYPINQTSLMYSYVDGSTNITYPSQLGSSFIDIRKLTFN